MKNLSQVSGMPQITSAFNGWFQNINLGKVTQPIINGLVQKVVLNFSFVGTIQPLSPKEIMLKPDGQRAWTWLQIHCQTADVIDVNDIIVYNGQNYKVMALKNYGLNGYYEYHAIENYQGEP